MKLQSSHRLGCTQLKTWPLLEDQLWRKLSRKTVVWGPSLLFGCWQNATTVLQHMNFSTGLLKCLLDRQLATPRASDPRDRTTRTEAAMSLWLNIRNGIILLLPYSTDHKDLVYSGEGLQKAMNTRKQKSLGPYGKLTTIVSSLARNDSHLSWCKIHPSLLKATCKVSSAQSPESHHSKVQVWMMLLKYSSSSTVLLIKDIWSKKTSYLLPI